MNLKNKKFRSSLLSRSIHRSLLVFGSALLIGGIMVQPSFAQDEDEKPAETAQETEEKPAERKEETSAQTEKPAEAESNNNENAERNNNSDAGDPTNRRVNVPPPSSENGEEGEGRTRTQNREPRNPPKEAAKFKISTNAENIKMILHPQGNPKVTDLQVTQGTEFVTDVQLINQAQRPVEQIQLIIDYNPSFISPRVINDSAISDKIDGQPKAVVDRKLGQIVYQAKLAEPLTEPDNQIIYLSWEANEPVIDSLIRFGRNRKIGFSEITSEGLPALGEPQEDGDGTVSMNVTVIPSDPAEALMMQEEPQLYMGTNERIGGIRLSFIPPPEIPRVGEVFPIQLYIDNDAYSKLDGVSALIKFDGDVLEILDEDFDNWITLGHNINDGQHRDEFPFNYHMANAVYPTRGLIEYRVGSSQPDIFVGVSGVFATIYAKAKKPAKDSKIEFVFANKEGLRTTEIKYLGEDALGESKVSNDGVRNLSLTILPEQRSETTSSSVR